MNVHHLELFFYVAKYEGITSAVRKMPYGIQQPAVSGQMLQLEESLGVKLFQRRPFTLTPEGEDLYDFIYPFFSQLPTVTERLSGIDRQHLRVVASSLVLSNYLPMVADVLRKKYGDLRLRLRESTPENIEKLLISQEVDIAVTAIQNVSSGFRFEQLVEVPLVLVVSKENPFERFEDLPVDSDGGITLPLISLQENEVISLIFQAELEAREINWQPKIEVNSFDLVQVYAEKGFGAGVMVDIPGTKIPSSLHKIPLTGFPHLVVGALYMGKLKPLCEDFLKVAKGLAKRLT